MLKNATIYRLSAPWAMTAEALESLLVPQRFAPLSSLEMKSQGWAPVREHGTLVHVVNHQILLSLQTESKILPAKVINKVVKERAIELEEQQGFPPGRKQTKELKEQITDELLPRALSKVASMFTWIDPVNGWLVCDASATARAEDALKLMLKAIPKFPLETLRTVRSPLAAMTDWLASDEAPAGFTIDQDAELQASGDSKATVRFVRHTLDPDDVRRHIESGKQCTRLAMTWSDRISFTLTEGGVIKGIKLLDVLKEDSDGSSKNEDERFDGDFMLMTGELNKLLGDLVAALGGFIVEGAEPVHGTPSVAAQSPESELPDDELYDQAVAVVLKNRRVSISLVQRHLRIGYNRAARLLEQMEVNGAVSAMQSNGNRTILAV